MKQSKAFWGFKSFKADPDLVNSELHKISKNRDEISPQDIVEYAKKNENSELHKCFTWDDTEAAEKWRVHQARQILCNLKIEVYETKKEKPIEVRVYQINDTQGGYKETKVMIQDATEYEKLRQVAIQYLKEFEKKYAIIKELQGVFDAIDKVLSEVA